MSISADQWNAAIRVVLAKAATDSSFREKCLNDASAAICEASGVVAPANVRFSEEPHGDAIVLPPLSSDPDELRDQELLENVAGGGVNTYPSIGDPQPSGCGI